MRKSAKYFLNNNGKKLLAASVMALLLSGSAQPVLAASAEILDGTANDKYAQVNSGDIYGTVYGVRNDADASGGTIKMNEGAAFNLYGGLSFNKNEAKADNNVVTINNGKVVFAVYGGQAQGHDADASGNIVSISGSNSELSFEGGAHSVAGGFAQTYSANTSVTANNNVVAVTGGLLKAGIAGGYILGNHNAASAQGEANDNIVFVGGSAKVNGDIYGANAEFKTGDTTASMNNNMVIVSGNADISNAALHGIGSSGSSGGSSSTPAVTVPVSGSGDTVHVSASVSGSTAEVKEIKSAELDKIGTDSAVVIDLSGLNKGVTSVTLSTDTIDSICKTEADGVTVKLPSAELRVDRQTLAAVTEQAAGSKIRLVVEPDSTARSTMTAAQRSTLAGMKNAAALEAYFVSNNTRIHDFKGGSVELSIPYRAKGAIRAWFLKEDGTREPVSARYDKENAQLILHHFSHYVIEELDSSAAYTVCAKDDSCPLGAFGDLTAAAWYHDGVHYCLENGLMQGVSGGKFLPDGSTTRAQLVMILWRLEGSPETTGAVRFGDTAGGAWYTEAVRWAVGCGVVKGYDNECFGPNDAVTREQMAAILYRYAQHKGYDVSAGKDTNILSFDDAFAVSEYAIPAMQWACGSGMVHGIARDGRMLLAPGDTTTRAQTATLLMRFQSAFAKES